VCYPNGFRLAEIEITAPRVGDIFQVLLPDGRFAYGKVFRDASVGIYETVFESPVKYLSNRLSLFSLVSINTFLKTAFGLLFTNPFPRLMKSGRRRISS
jgi:hypothetical protein